MSQSSPITNPSSEIKRWSFSPELPEKRPYRKPRNQFPWVAPEHVRVAMSMDMDFPRNDLGWPVEGSRRELKIDKRPTIMVPPRKTYIGTKHDPE